LLLGLAAHVPPLLVLGRQLVVEIQGFRQKPRAFDTRPECCRTLVLRRIVDRLLKAPLHSRADDAGRPVFELSFRHQSPPKLLLKVRPILRKFMSVVSPNPFARQPQAASNAA